MVFWEQDNFERLTTAGLCVPTQKVIRLNDIFDPLGAAGALQPNYRDQWAVFFQKYRVLSAKWAVTAYADSTTNTGTDTLLTAGVFPADTAVAVVNTTEEVQQSKRFQKRSMRNRQGTSNEVTLSGHAKIQNYVQSRNPEDLSALMSASPTDLVVLNIGYANLHGGAAVSASVDIRTKIRIEYTVLLFSPIVLGQS